MTDANWRVPSQGSPGTVHSDEHVPSWKQAWAISCAANPGWRGSAWFRTQGLSDTALHTSSLPTAGSECSSRPANARTVRVCQYRERAQTWPLYTQSDRQRWQCGQWVDSASDRTDTRLHTG